ncbi:GNAT family N-acetyltransferase [Pseudidiomarina donghaiensis]|uniref:N-acetyltransferase n=1 Tax=Pseudidiomarina donghaiensis TaxID=519452 RepID=A0A432XFC8_9GAMM|nr:N-acetyltransferase [Pseudidiomarina donghaiensis]RUO47469.1 N-acetyltransferase [Pseudidiomarina donghaiensis]SFV23087.1 Ribosomal protein S18 acetylase RimI [Pseudidiomarina donghaiensis]
MSTVTTNCHFREATSADVAALVALESRCFDYSRMGPKSFKRLINAHSAHVYLCECDGTLMGYLLLLTRRNSRIWRLYSIATAPAARGLGIGKQLLEFAIFTAKQHGASALSLEVKTDNTPAIKLYEKYDFAVVDVLPDYYDDGTDGYRMRLSLWSEANGLENR